MFGGRVRTILVSSRCTSSLVVLLVSDMVDRERDLIKGFLSQMLSCNGCSNLSLMLKEVAKIESRSGQSTRVVGVMSLLPVQQLALLKATTSLQASRGFADQHRYSPFRYLIS